METRSNKAHVDQAWVLTRDISGGDQLVGVLDHHLSSSLMLEIVTQIYITSQLTAYEQLQLQHDSMLGPRASFIYLNDGSLFEDHIVCSMRGREASLWACRAQNIVILEDQNGKAFISWQVTHVIADDRGERTLDFIDELTVEVSPPAS